MSKLVFKDNENQNNNGENINQDINDDINMDNMDAKVESNPENTNNEVVNNQMNNNNLHPKQRQGTRARNFHRHNRNGDIGDNVNEDHHLVLATGNGLEPQRP